MPDDVIYVPMSRKLYNDVIRFSDGTLDPAYIAETQLVSWIERDLEFGSESHWGDRFDDVAEEYAPHLLERREQSEKEEVDKRRALVWKEISISSGSDVRMFYGSEHHYAKVQGGAIVEADGKRYSPSEWARMIAGNTSRNAWRDLWFREPTSKTWIPAQLLREQAREEAASRQR